MSRAVQAIDLHRASTCQGLLTLGSSYPNYNARLQALILMDTEVTVINTILQTDPSQLSVWVQRQRNFFDTNISTP